MATVAAETARTFQIVVAATRQLGIGKNGALPWRLPADLAYFKELTSATRDPQKQNAVVMGRKTWESIPPKFQPLKGRLNVVLRRSFVGDENRGSQGNSPASEAADLGKGVLSSGSLEGALALLASQEYSSRVETVFVIGGGQVYKEAVQSQLCSAVHITRIHADFECDTFFPAPDPALYRLWSASEPRTDGGVRYEFLCYTRGSADEPPQLPPEVASSHEEYQYLELIDDVMRTGVDKADRTGTGTVSKFGGQMRFNLRHTFPLLTTKRVFWRGVAEELLWFVSGSTNANQLMDKGIHIWDGNGSREYLDSIGLCDREEGDLGPVYGFQWRHFGAEYSTMHADYSGQGVDQLANIIETIKTNPDDRRMVLSAWNPAALKGMALPPCHMFCQFYVANGELSCQMYQRSCDLGLGVPFNIASYSLLTCLVAHVCDLVPGDFVHVLGDAHVYQTHVAPLRRQLCNAPRHFPILKIKSDRRSIDDFKFEDLELIGYNPHRKIDMPMAV